MFRIQLTSNTSAKNPIAEKIILVDTFDKLKTQASQKFKFKLSKVRLFVAKPLMNARLGTEIISNDQFQTIVLDDMLLAVSNGENFKRKILSQGLETISIDVVNKLKFPPRYPYPGKHSDIKLSSESIESNKYSNIEDNIIVSSVSVKDTNDNKEFNGIFPILEGNILHLIKQITSANSKIKMIEANGYISFDYDDNMIFPEVKSWDDALLRECRGLIISSVTGKVLARRFHKFFNLNEIIELENINSDYSTLSDSIAYEKLDGKLITPILRDDNILIWATRRMRDLEVEEFITKSEVDYVGFSLEIIGQNITPIFEYCTNQTPIGVIAYENTNLILTALRHNVTGEYISIENYRNNDYSIPIVKQIPHQTTSTFMSDVKNLINKEGVVIYTKSGELLKLKSKWYMDMVMSQSAGQKMFLSTFVTKTKTLQNIPKNKIFMFAIQNHDDEIAEINTILLENSRKKELAELKNFIQIVQRNISLLEIQLSEWMFNCFKIVQSKEVILSVGENAGWNVDLLNDIFEQKQSTLKLKNFLIKFGMTNKTNILAELLDVDWNCETCQINYDNVIMSDIANETYTFDELNKLDDFIINHVLQKYLPKKIANLFGLKSVDKNTIINFHNSYVGNEGKLIGMYELISEQYQIHDLRVDVQDKRKEYSKHYGNDEYVNLQVQSGRHDEQSISYAGILIPTDSDFCFGDISEALKQSFDTGSLIKLRRKTFTSKFKIFCDLDGVLVDFDKGVHDLTGKPVTFQTPQKMWQRIANHPNFFEELDPTPYGIEMWNSILNISQQVPTILTGVTSNVKYEQGKRDWVRKHLENDNKIEVIVCNSSDKYKYVSTNHILIDDRLEMGRPWVANGGIFIHHINPERTLYNLGKIFGIHNKKQHHLEPIESDELVDYRNNLPIEFIVNEWPEITDSVICLDTEWKYNDMSILISIIQIATRSKVYIVDMINCSDIVSEQMTELLSDNKITKICFGLSEDESNRIGTDIKNVYDIQEILIGTFDNFSKCHTPSLELSTALLLKKKLGKSKEISLSDWNVRPLSQSQLTYASNDVTILFEIYDELLSKQLIKNHYNKHIFNEKTITIRKNREEIKTEFPVRIHSVGIFITPSSRDDILKKLTIQHKNVHNFYAIIRMYPLKCFVSELSIGKMVQLKITKVINYESIQIAICVYKEFVCQLLISSDCQLINYEIITNCSERIISEIVCDINIYGVIGIFAQQISDDLITLSENVRKKILDFKTTAQPNENLKFKAGELSGMERSIIHEYARNNNMESYSTGKPTDRQLILTMKRRTDNSVLTNIINENNNPKQKIIDQLHYSSMIIVDNDNTKNSNKIEKYYDVIIDDISNGLVINNKSLVNKLEYPTKLIILRGLPGSGKSHLTNVNEFTKAVICSADDYFYKGGIYEFNPEELQSAHNNCYNLCVEYLHNKKHMIIVDNTNSTLKELKKYIDAGNSFGYMIIVLEIECENFEQATMFNKRCVHGVPLQTELCMFNRWEKYENSYMVKPYSTNPNNKLGVNLIENKSLNVWLEENKLIHTNKLKNKSHMIMAVDGIPPRFLDIPDILHDEFYRKYAEAVENGENLYIMEYCSRYPKFKYVVDFDYVDDKELEYDKIIYYTKELQQVLISYGHIPDVYITGNITMTKMKQTKTGLHLSCPNCLVTRTEAIDITTKYQEMLSIVEPTINWKNVVDISIYRENSGLRMFGSKKATNSNPYKLLAILDENGNEINNRHTTYELLKILSLYNK